MTKPKAKRGAVEKYPWSRWLRKGSRHRLSCGKHFDCSTRSMTVYLYQVARRKKVRITVESINNSEILLKVHN